MGACVYKYMHCVQMRSYHTHYFGLPPVVCNRDLPDHNYKAANAAIAFIASFSRYSIVCLVILLPIKLFGKLT